MEFLSVRSGVEPPVAPFGWGMKIREDPNKHKSLHEPLPLDGLEEALLIGIGTGTGITAFTLADMPYTSRPEKTEEPVPLTMFDTYLLSAVGAEAAFIVHNIMLSEQAMALGGWILGGATSFLVMGGTPMCRGSSFRFEQTKKPQAFPVPVGIDGSFESLRPPYMDAAVDAIVAKKFGPKGRFNPFSKKLAPYENDQNFIRQVPRTPEKTIAICKETRRYIWGTFGTLPAIVPSMVLYNYAQAQHIELEFYDKYYRGGAYLKTHREHIDRRHRKGRAARKVT